MRLPLLSFQFLIALALTTGMLGCTSTEPTGSSGGGDVQGIWIGRLTADGSGDRTDLAIGTILGAPANRVWACELRPRSNTAIVIQGTLNGDRIRWDPIYGTPDYVVGRSGEQLFLEVPGCEACRRTFYERGAWNGICGELDVRPTNIFVQFGVWDAGPSATITSLSSALTCVQGPTVGPVHEQCRPGQTRFSTTLQVGTSTLTATDVVANLVRPDSGMRRFYMLGWRFQPILGRYLVDQGNFVDRPEEGAVLSVVSGNGQQGFPGTRLPLPPTVRVATPNGRPIPGVTVTFDIPGNADGSYGSLEGGPSVVTDADGIARLTSWTLGTEVGGQTLRVRAPFVSGSPLLMSATVIRDEPTAVVAGRNRTCALGSAGTIFCWGRGVTRPQRVTSPVALTTLALGDNSQCGLTAEGRAYCWGQGSSGELGLGPTTGFATEPTLVSGTLTFQRLAGHGANFCGLTTAGAAYCWGENAEGQIGDGTTTNRFVPTLVSGGHTFTGITVGFEYACGLTSAGAARCWGRNTLASNAAQGGQLGDGTRTRRLTPTLVSGGLTFSQLSAGFAHTCGLLSTGQARCWGVNFSGQIGDSLATADRLVPATVVGGRTYTSIAGGGGFTCALTSSSERWCWGSNTVGQFDIGFNSTGTTRGYPIRSSGGGAPPQAAGIDHACWFNPVSTERQLRCVGGNSEGQLGDGTTSSRSTSVWVLFP
jgi:alpha-tubulin suppressor-like RCC1 family protein